MSNWSKIKHLYPDNWREISHNIRFVRARGRCEHCGVLHGQRRLFSPKASPVILATAHRDHDPGNNSATNLMSLCQECHLAHDRTDNLQRAQQTRRTKKDLLRPLLALIHSFTEKNK